MDGHAFGIVRATESIIIAGPVDIIIRKCYMYIMHNASNANPSFVAAASRPRRRTIPLCDRASGSKAVIEIDTSDVITHKRVDHRLNLVSTNPSSGPVAVHESGRRERISL
jgi:hypothetical protein